MTLKERIKLVGIILSIVFGCIPVQAEVVEDENVIDLNDGQFDLTIYENREYIYHVDGLEDNTDYSIYSDNDNIFEFL